MTESGKPAVLIIGGLGFLGRWLAHYIHTNKLASEIRVVDKQLPQLAWLAPEFEEPCKNFVQADMSKEHAIKRVFDREDGSNFDYVFNCAGETKYQQSDETYRARNLDLPVLCAKEAASRGVKLFVEVSEGRVYGDGSKGKTESAECHPWLPLAKYKLEAEKELQKIEGLNLVILRLANAYGPYSSRTLSTAVCHARVYQYLDRQMELLWTKDLKVNTIHISDFTRAVWHTVQWYVDGKKGWDDSWGKTPLFNVVDDGDTNQGIIAACVEEVFGIKIKFYGTVLSLYATRGSGASGGAVDDPSTYEGTVRLVDDVNEGVLEPWTNLLAEANITKPSPITPYVEVEQLKDSDLSLDGTRFKNVTGFEYEVPVIGAEQIKDIVESYKRMGSWP